MFSPIPHDLTIYDDKFEFEKNGFCPHQWEISVKQKNCIIWSVVLSYLKSADFTVPGKFEERLNRLTKNMIDPELAKSAILDFNPFFNKHKCFFDETLQEIVLYFKKVVKDKRPSKESKSVRKGIKMISLLLKSNILIVSLRSKNLYLITPSNGNFTDAPAITLFCREYSNKETQDLTLRFTLSLSKDLCWELRNNAFQILLESTESRDIVHNAMQALTEKKEKKINILIALLKKNLTREISELYDSPYTMRKLADAGFETDPRVVDVDGFSAFYYAAQSCDKNLVYILYRYAANSCNESDNTYRDPDPGIISNFSTLEEILNEDCARSENFKNLGDRAEQALLTYQHLQRFNDFLTQVSHGINEIRGRPEGQLNDDLRKMDRAKKQKEIILLILDKYGAFFAVGQEEFNISEYTKHKTYYDNLDLTVALLFFDNMFLLKSRLKSPREGLYSELESSFLLSAVTKVKIQDLGFESDSGDLTIIPLLERRNLRENIKEFCSILREKEMVKEDIVDCIPKPEITGMLSNFLQLKDEILISRLDHYLRTALKTVEGGMKQKFVIERALQVIGESINIENVAPDSIRHLLRKCLPEDTLTVLKRTRNTLSHLESFQFPLKFNTEEDDTLFRSIQSEIRDIKEAFKEAFDIQRVRLKEFIIDSGLKSIQNIPQSAGVEVFNEDHQLVRDMENFKDSLRKRMSEFKCGTNGHRVSVPNINEFCRRLMGYASKSDEKQIRGEIPPEVKNREDAIHNLEEEGRKEEFL
ncbi:hypothetical protein AVEN_82806-1 [Araneus ventricosus]|uniref:Uncharacterized protein n=1 Tax=Araneus ventricosus TaxID=182803 RepID=A0A4Y2DBY8_ARAVE|nr:hypothetical protein AVEN_82806-1 [Araneus ventricosus]